MSIQMIYGDRQVVCDACNKASHRKTIVMRSAWYPDDLKDICITCFLKELDSLVELSGLIREVIADSLNP